MQGKNFVIPGSGQLTVVAPCTLEAADLIDSAHTFTFQYADDTANANPIGDAVAAEQLSATCFEFKVERARKTFWTTGQTIGYVVGTAGDTIALRPRRTGM